MTSLEYLALRGEIKSEIIKEKISMMYFMAFCAIVGAIVYLIYRIINAYPTETDAMLLDTILLIITFISFIFSLAGGFAGLITNADLHKKLYKLDEYFKKNNSVESTIISLDLCPTQN